MMPDQRSEETPPAPTISRADRSFVEDAIKSGHQVVAISQAVVDRVQNPEVKRFAEKIIASHSEANSSVAELASRKAIQWPAYKARAADKWSRKDADDLDEDYVEEMAAEHKKAVGLFEKATRSVDTDIAAFAAKTLPVLQRHLDQAETLEKQLD